jgi:phosphohistidine phosphatase
MRHAKAEPYAETDAERELTPRGAEAATAAGQHLADLRVIPDHVLVSSAVRTRQTWDAVRASSGSTATEEISDQLYAANPEAVLETIRLVPAETGICLYLGHNPTAAHLAAALDDGEADPEVLQGLLAGFPTCAMAVFEVRGEWSELGESGARLINFYPGRP